MIISRTPIRISFVGGGTDIANFYREHGGEGHQYRYRQIHLC